MKRRVAGVIIGFLTAVGVLVGLSPTPVLAVTNVTYSQGCQNTNLDNAAKVQHILYVNVDKYNSSGTDAVVKWVEAKSYIIGAAAGTARSTRSEGDEMRHYVPENAIWYYDNTLSYPSPSSVVTTGHMSASAYRGIVSVDMVFTDDMIVAPDRGCATSLFGNGQSGL